MAEFTPNETLSPNIAAVTNSKSSLQESAGTSPLNPHQQLVFVRYRDHVLYNRSSALMMQPQIREAVGWLVYDCEFYIILAWDRDAQPPTLKGGDPKASGLVLLKSDILELQNLKICPYRNLELNLNCQLTKQELEYAFRPTERKTQPKEIKKK